MGKVRGEALRIQQRRDETIVKAALHPQLKRGLLRIEYTKQKPLNFVLHIVPQERYSNIQPQQKTPRCSHNPLFTPLPPITFY